jgi:ubiquinone/menaquinone biosynthesis C-methylase UbiE
LAGSRLRSRPLAAGVIGLDISPAMIAAARARCARFANVRFVLGTGYDLAAIPTESVELVTLIDVFPYLLLSEGALAERYLREIARVLSPGGDLMILGLAYEEDRASAERELARRARAADLTIVRARERPCPSWDAPAVHLVKRGPAAVRRP